MSNPKKTYEQKRDTKRVSFNKEKESELLNFANSVDFSNWVKDKIKREIGVANNEQDAIGA